MKKYLAAMDAVLPACTQQRSDETLLRFLRLVPPKGPSSFGGNHASQILVRVSSLPMPWLVACAARQRSNAIAESSRHTNLDYRAVETEML